MANITPKFLSNVANILYKFIDELLLLCEVVKRLPYQLANIKIIFLTIFMWCKLDWYTIEISRFGHLLLVLFRVDQSNLQLIWIVEK